MGSEQSPLQQRLTQARENAGLSTSQVAHMFKYQRVIVADWELGDLEPSDDETMKLAEIYDVSLDWLVNGTPQKVNPFVYTVLPGSDREKLFAMLQMGTFNGGFDDAEGSNG